MVYPVIPFCSCTDSSFLALLNSSCPCGFSSHQSPQIHQVLVHGEEIHSRKGRMWEDEGWSKELWTLTLFNPLETFLEREQMEHTVCGCASLVLFSPWKAAPVCLTLCKSVLEIWVSEWCSSYGWKFQHFELSHSFPFSSLLLGLYLILVVSHQLLHHRPCPASLKVSLGQCKQHLFPLNIVYSSWFTWFLFCGAVLLLKLQ